jgi:two-component system, NarL family, invasion response regulator UvrY
MTNVLLVDDHAVVREGYKRLIDRAPDLCVAGEASTGADAVRLCVAMNPDVTVMDISLPDKSGFEALAQIVAQSPAARVLMFSIHDEQIYVERALGGGACGYVTKASAPVTLVEAIRAVVRGEIFVSPDLSASQEGDTTRRMQDAVGALTARELEIARLLVAGLSVAKIAQRLSLTEKTIANFQTTIRRKLEAPTAARLVEIAKKCNALMSGRSADNVSPNRMTALARSRARE